MESDTKIYLSIKDNNGIRTIEYDKNETLLQALHRAGYPIRSDCGGRGSCGKCKIRLVEGELSVTEQDSVVFGSKELYQGFRLSCKAYAAVNCTIEVFPYKEEGFHAVCESSIDNTDSLSDNEMLTEGYAIGIDLGTTTLAFSLVDIGKRTVIHNYSMLNHQRVYGSDVVSRIQASNNGKLLQLKEIIQKDITEGIHQLIIQTGTEASKVKKIAIAGNTTMGHLLLGYSCETLGKYPFQPAYTGEIILRSEDIFTGIHPIGKETPVVILPGISAFVGGDVVAGLYLCGFYQSERNNILIDLGTNGEMALGNKERILVTSTAAGPAFEGVNISCGVGSIAGAISRVTIRNKEVEYQTIGNKPPVGLCGTGVIELSYELLKENHMDMTGLLKEEYFDNGFSITGTAKSSHMNQQDGAEDTEGQKIIFTQRDIRELQLAKAAIRAGIEILLSKTELSYEDIDTVYLAGGFGFTLNLDKAIKIGLLPKEFMSKLQVVGNSSLSGAVLYLKQKDAADMMKHIITSAKEVHLSNEPDFNEKYIEHMNFSTI